MRQNILPAIRLTLICAVFFSGIYTLLIFGIAQAAPNNGKGEIITRKESSVKNENEFKTIYYYTNIGQKFDKDEYFWSRPSAVNYNAAGAEEAIKALLIRVFKKRFRTESVIF
ncbi:potassium-transporting ATPase subunit C [Chryseobacterium arachidis]|uniref:potassium-transporting ATPase subunit C n=1 Tax=Chryseobacterium arachidis TaxID=1416778 RepID=UPI00361D4172